MARPNDIVAHMMHNELYCTMCIAHDGITPHENSEVTRWDVDTGDVCASCGTTLHPDSAVYIIGSNMAGYLPDSEPFTVVGTFEDARSALIGELELALDYSHNDEEDEEIREAIEDVECWRSPDSVRVGMYVHWISRQ